MTDRSADLPTIELYPDQLEALLDYSMTLPTGTTVGKMWRRDCNVFRKHLGPDWIVGRYVPSSDPGYIGIEWLRPVWPGGWSTAQTHRTETT